MPIHSPKGIARLIHVLKNQVVQTITQYCMSIIINEVIQFIRVFFQIIEFISRHQVYTQFISSVKYGTQRLESTKTIMVYLKTSKLHEDRLLRLIHGRGKCVKNAASFYHIRNSNPCSIQNRRCNTNQRDRSCSHQRTGNMPLPSDNKRNTGNIIIDAWSL